MKIEESTRKRIIKNAFLSLFIYALPIALMFVTFAITGEKPWTKKQVKTEKNKSINPRNTTNNGTSD